MTDHYFKVSPTKIKEYGRCPRLWFFNYVLDLKPAATASMARGTEVHNILEQYYVTGNLPEDTKMRAVLALAPPKAEGVMSETWLNITLPGEILVRQKADVIDVRNPSCPVIYDFKTMKNFNYALESDQLAQDIQLLSYAYAVATLYTPDATQFKVCHIQIPLDISAPPRLVSATVELVDLLSRWSFTEKNFILQMKEDAAKHVSELEAKFGHACEQYGGCPHKIECLKVHTKGKEYTPMRDKWIDKINSEKAPLVIHPPAPKGLTTAEFMKTAKEKHEEPQSRPIQFLFIDCFPTGIEVQRISEVISPVLEGICKSEGVPDWRLVDYGKGKGLITAGVRKLELNGSFFISSREDYLSSVLEALGGKVAVVVKGTGA